jgi:3-phosphoglycerate kinase
MNLYGIGPETVARFNEILGGSKTIYIKGSPTKDDDERFLSESQQLIDSIVQLKKKGATTIVSGGDTNNLVSRLHYFPQTDFTFSTLAGGAATEYHSGILLPGLLMLNTSYNQFNGRTLSEGLENYNFGFKLESPKKPVDLI